MTGGGFNKTGWHWTRKGWKRTPKHLQGVKKVAAPKKRKHRKQVQVKGIEPEAPKFALQLAKPVSAPTPAPDAAEPLPRQYRELDGVTKRLNRLPPGRISIVPTWAKKKPQPETPKPAKRVWHGKYDELHKPPEPEA